MTLEELRSLRNGDLVKIVDTLVPDEHGFVRYGEAMERYTGRITTVAIDTRDNYYDDCVKLAEDAELWLWYPEMLEFAFIDEFNCEDIEDLDILIKELGFKRM